MDIIKEFNNKLNNSFEKRNKSGISFLEEVDLTLKSTIQKMDHTRQALIIGAGKMEDFSLCFFVKYFDKVVVTDIDIKTSKEVVSKMNLRKSERQKVILKELEYTGFGIFDFFEDFRKDIVKAKSFDEIELFLNEKIENIKKYSFLEYDFKKYDFIYVSPIYTQLIYNQILLECSLLRQSGYQENFLKFIENKMLDEMIQIIDRFNQNLQHLLSENGVLFVLSDVFEVNVGSPFDLRISTAIKNRDVTDGLYESYKKKYGMGFGDYGLYSLDEKMEVLRYKWLIWPFKESTNLVVKLKIYKKIQPNKEV